MKKSMFLTLSILIVNICLNASVFACGEIKNVYVDSGVVFQTSDHEYVIRVKEGTSKVTIHAETDYNWVEGYGPRTVSTNNEVELKVDGYKCGYGIYNNTFTFETLSTIAENTPDTAGTENETANQNIEPTNDDNLTSNNTSTPPSTTQNTDVVLKNLVITGYDINFHPSTFTYTLEVESDITALEIIPTKDVDSDVVTISSNASNLSEGLNVVTITISTTDAGTAVYTINVNRKETLSGNNYLASLSVEGYQVNFDPSTSEYSIEIGKEVSLKVNALTEDKSATTTITGNNAIGKSSDITVTVKAANGQERVYTIHVKRVFNIKDYWQYIAVAGGMLLLIILLIINSKSKKKKKNAPSAISNQGEKVNTAPPTASSSTSVPTENIEAPVKPLAQVDNSQLQIIEPTNIESSSQDNSSNSDMEVFKL